MSSQIFSYYNGKWHDENAKVLALSAKDEAAVIQKISDLESSAYGDVMPEYIMLDDAETVADIIDYLDCDKRNAFIWFSVDGPLYFLASANNVRYGLVKTVKFVEIADMNGKMTRGNVRVVDDFISWLKTVDAQCVYCDARETTSNKILNGNAVKKRLQMVGFVDASDVAGLLAEDENMVPRCFVKKSWLDKQSKSDLKKLKDMLYDEYIDESCNESYQDYIFKQFKYLLADN